VGFFKIYSLRRFLFCRLNILEVTGKAQVNAEGSNPGLCNELQVFGGTEEE